MLKQFWFILVIFACVPCIAATHFITASGSGAKNGSDWNNAFAGIPATLVRGDTYVLAGGSYGSHTFSTPASGTTPITIRKAQAGTFNGVTYNDDLVAGWNSTFQTTQAVITSASTTQWQTSTDYWNFDGVQPGTKWATSGFGIKITPASCSQSNYLLDAESNQVNLKNIQFVNCGQSFDFEQFDFIAGGSTGGNVSYCYFQYGAQNHVRLAGSTNHTIEYNYFEGISYFSDHHGEIINMLRQGFTSGPGPGNETIRYNWINDAATTNTTGQIVDLTNTGDTDNNVQIYGNIFQDFTGHNGIGSGNSGSPGALTNWKIYDNTIIRGVVDFACIASSSAEFRNNLIYNADLEIFNSCGGLGTRTNNYWNNSTNGIGAGTNDVTSGESTSVLFVNYSAGNFRLGTSSVATSGGFTLSSPLNIDPDGVIRGSPPGWSLGAFQFASPTAPPTNLLATVQ